MAIEILLQPKQQELIHLFNETDITQIGNGGARGGSKSGGGRRCILSRRLDYPKTTALIIRKTLRELEHSHIHKMFEEYPDLRAYYNEQKKMLTLPNKSVLFFGSAPNAGDVASFCSSEYADIMVDEAQEFTQDELERLEASNRCTSSFSITPKMLYTFMPGMSSDSGVPPVGLQYLKRVFVDGKLKDEENLKKWAFIQAFAWDNVEWFRKELTRDGITDTEFYSWTPEARQEYFINHTDYGRKLAGMTNKHLRDAWLYGKWDVFQGQYFSNFKPKRHVISDEDAIKAIKPWHKCWISGDWGWDHPLAVYFHSIDEHNRVTTFHEIYGREIPEVELAKKIGNALMGRKFTAFALSFDAGKLSKRSQPTFPRSIMQLIADNLPKECPKPHPTDSSPGSRIAGARLMSRLLDADMWHIAKSCTKLIEQIPTLIRDPDNTEDVMKIDFPVNQVGDDCYDGARYGLQYMLGSSFKPKEVQREEMLQTYDERIERIRQLRAGLN